MGELRLVLGGDILSQATTTSEWSLLYSIMVLYDILVHVEGKIMNFKLDKGSKIRKVGNKETVKKL